MEAKEKAKELVDKYYDLFSVKLENTICIYEAKHCALIAVDEMLQANVDLMENAENVRQYRFFEEVKQEIEKLC
jgi:hypothetical protein